jgi:hypothetical protein
MTSVRHDKIQRSKASHSGEPAERLQRFEDQIVRLREYGIRVVDGSRAPAYVATIRSFLASGRPLRELRGSKAIELMTAIAETEDFEMIARNLLVGGEIAAHEWKRRFELALTGRFRGTRVHDPARAAQFELFTAASCGSAGARPRHAEPDIIVVVGAKALAIAAKRLLSFGNLEENVRKARKQIAATGHDGLIALDFTAALNLQSRVHLVSGPASEFQEVFRTWMYRQLEPLVQRVSEWVLASPGGNRVRMVASFCRCMTMVRDTNELATFRYWIAGPVPALGYTSAPLRRFLLRLMAPG